MIDKRKKDLLIKLLVICIFLTTISSMEADYSNEALKIDQQNT